MERSQRLNDVAPKGGGCDLTGKDYIRCDKIHSESMLDAYLLYRLISLQQHAAGLRYSAICFGPQGRVKLESERIIREIHKTLTPGQLKIVQRVCCDNKMAGGTDAMETLRCGLDHLVRLRNIQ